MYDESKEFLKKATKKAVRGLKEDIVRQEELNARLTQENTALKL